MDPERQRAIVTVTLLAAFADGAKHDAEREEIRRTAAGLADATGSPDIAAVSRDVLLKRTSLQSAVAALDTPELRQLAYEMAVCVCDADGRQTPEEKRFLAELRSLLQLDAVQTAAFDRKADAVVELGEAATAPPISAPAAGSVPAVVSPAGTASAPSGAEVDQAILRYAVLCGALELLPQSWASLAIIPLQIKMVYGVGKAHGVALDQGHIKEFIAAAGVGLTSQYLEQFGRKLLGGLLGKAAGKSARKVGGAATGVMFSFATTYALGQLAKRYYAGGRTMSATLLRETFQNLLEPAKRMQASYLPQIEQQAGALDMNRIVNVLRSGTP